MKKSISILTAVLASAVIMSACGSAAEETDTASRTSMSSIVEAPKLPETAISESSAEITETETETETEPAPTTTEASEPQAADEETQNNEISENTAHEKFNKLINSFTSETDSSNNPTVEYPDNYGGAFYDNRTLNIMLTDISESAVAAYADVVGNDGVNYIKCEYSYNYLFDLNDYIVGLMSEKKYNINETGIYQKANIVNTGVSTDEDARALTDDLLSQGYDKNSFEIDIFSAPVPAI